MKSITVLTTMIILLFPSLLSAKVFQQAFNVDYVLGDGDSKITARELALEQLKIKASSKAGSYIHTTNTLINEQLIENIQVIGAAMVTLSKIEERVLTKNNQMILSVSALARIDEEELNRRIVAMQQDVRKAKQITQLTKENELLTKELRTIQSLLSKKYNSSMQVSSILQRQSDLMKRFKSNTTAVKRIFSEGTLFQMAKRSTSNFEQLKAQIETEFFAVLMQTDIKAEIVDVIENEIDFTVLVNVSWEVPTSLSYATVNKHLKGGGINNKSGRSEKDLISIDYYDNVDGKGKTTLSESLFNYLGKQHVFAAILLGNKSFGVPLFWAKKGGVFDGCDSRSPKRDFIKSHGLLCLNLKQHSNKGLVATGDEFDANPIKFTFTRQEVMNITTIETQIIRG